MSGAGGRRRSLGGGALALALLVGCAGPQQAARPSGGDGQETADETSGRDAGARLWVAHHAPRGDDGPTRSVLELVVDPSSTPKRAPLTCPSPLATCPEGASASAPEPEATKRHQLKLYWNRDEPLDREDVPECVATGLVTSSGRVACDNLLDRAVVLERRGDELVVRLDGRWWLGASTAAEVERTLKTSVDELGPAELTLQRAHPLRVAFARAGQPSRAGSSETRHLSALVDPLERAAAEVPELSVDAIEAVIVERGFDPRTLPLETAFRIEREVAQYGLYALRMPPAERSALAREVVDEALQALDAP